MLFGYLIKGTNIYRYVNIFRNSENIAEAKERETNEDFRF